jgi:GTPase SAR1 family protein
MRDEWKEIFTTDKQLYFGDLYDKTMLSDYYFEDKNLEDCRNNILNYIDDEYDYSPILIGGDAGVGKSTFINNLISMYLPSESYFNIILNVDNQPNNPLTKEYLIKQLRIYLDSLLSGDIIGSKNISKYKKEYQQYVANEMFYKIIEERIDNILDLLSRTLKHLKEKKQIYPKLIIFLDQVERFGSDTLINYISEYISYFSGSRSIRFILCARKETIVVARQSIKGFFSTYFKRNIVIESPPIEKVLQKRFNTKKTHSITIEKINNYFTKTFCDLIENISNNNLRIMLRTFEKLIETSKPYKGRDGYGPYFRFLIDNEYIDNLYKTINQADTIPLIKIVFDALQYYGMVDEKFYRVITAKVFTIRSIKNTIGLTTENINIAVKHLLENDFIIDSFEIKNKYNLTKKGIAYSKFIETSTYSKVFIKDINAENFKRNIFNDQDFVRNISNRQR